MQCIIQMVEIKKNKHHMNNCQYSLQLGYFLDLNLLNDGVVTAAVNDAVPQHTVNWLQGSVSMA